MKLSKDNGAKGLAWFRIIIDNQLLRWSITLKHDHTEIANVAIGMS